MRFSILMIVGVIAWAGTVAVPPVSPVEPVEEKCPCKCKG